MDLFMDGRQFPLQVESASVTGDPMADALLLQRGFRPDGTGGTR